MRPAEYGFGSRPSYAPPLVTPEEFISDPGKQLYEDTQLFSGSLPTRADLASHQLTPWMPGISTAVYWPEMGPVGKTFSTGADVLDLLTMKATAPLTMSARAALGKQLLRRTQLPDPKSLPSWLKATPPVANRPYGYAGWMDDILGGKHGRGPEYDALVQDAFDKQVRVQDLANQGATFKISGSPGAPMGQGPYGPFEVGRGKLGISVNPMQLFPTSDINKILKQIYSTDPIAPLNIGGKTVPYSPLGSEIERLFRTQLSVNPNPRLGTETFGNVGFGQAQDVIPGNPYLAALETPNVPIQYPAYAGIDPEVLARQSWEAKQARNAAQLKVFEEGQAALRERNRLLLEQYRYGINPFQSISGGGRRDLFVQAGPMGDISYNPTMGSGMSSPMPIPGIMGMGTMPLTVPARGISGEIME